MNRLMNKLKLGTPQRGATTAQMFSNVLIVIVLAIAAFGIYLNSRLDSGIADALALGEENKGMIEEYLVA